jgi:two-component system nitrate/nitrite response regulator NarP
MAKPYSVLVVDDHPLLRRGIGQLIASDDDFILFGEAGSGIEAIAAMDKHEPDLVLLDLHMKGLSGLDTLAAMRQEGITSRIIVLTVSDAKQDVINAHSAGADGYLLKDTEPELLLTALKQSMSGLAVTSEEVLGFWQLANQTSQQTDELSQFRVGVTTADDSATLSQQQPKETSVFALLTPRELQILQQLAIGKSNRAICETLHISEGTVKVHVKNLLKKANAKSRTEIAVRYLATSA